MDKKRRGSDPLRFLSVYCGSILFVRKYFLEHQSAGERTVF